MILLIPHVAFLPHYIEYFLAFQTIICYVYFLTFRTICYIYFLGFQTICYVYFLVFQTILSVMNINYRKFIIAITVYILVTIGFQLTRSKSVFTILYVISMSQLTRKLLPMKITSVSIATFTNLRNFLSLNP